MCQVLTTWKYITSNTSNDYYNYTWINAGTAFVALSLKSYIKQTLIIVVGWEAQPDSPFSLFSCQQFLTLP